MNFEYFFFHCSAAVITAYLMRKEQKSLEGLNDILCKSLHSVYHILITFTCFLIEYFFCYRSLFADALQSLKEVCEFVSPNDGFLDQVRCNLHSITSFQMILPFLIFNQ